MKSKLAVAAIIIFLLLALPASADQLLFAMSTPSGPLGSSQVYGTGLNTITAYGFYENPNTHQNDASALYGKTGGGDENGVGLHRDPTGDNEISTNDFIEIDFSKPIRNLNITGVKFQMGSVQGGEGWALYGSNGIGQLGTNKLASVTGVDGTYNIPNFGGYTYYTWTATSANVLLNEIEIDYSAGSATPEPATYLMFGGALIAVAMLGRRKAAAR